MPSSKLPIFVSYAHYDNGSRTDCPSAGLGATRDAASALVHVQFDVVDAEAADRVAMGGPKEELEALDGV